MLELLLAVQTSPSLSTGDDMSDAPENVLVRRTDEKCRCRQLLR